MEMKIPAIAITALVVIVVLGGVLMPVLDDATAKTDTFTNDGLWRMKSIDNGDTWSKDSSTWTYNTDDVLEYGTNGSWNIALGDNWCVRGNGTARGTFVAGGSQGAEVIAVSDAISISGSGITSSGSTTITGYGYDSAGSYALTDPTVAPYVTSDTQVYATGTTEVSDGTNTANVLLHISGNIEDGITVTGYSLYSTTAFTSIDISNIEMNYEEVNDYIDLYKLNSMTFTITAVRGESTYTADATFTSYVVPYEVSAERSVHFSDNETAIFAAIPIMVIVALLIAVVALVFRGRDF